MRLRKKITKSLLCVLCTTVIFFGIILYFTISRKNIQNNITTPNTTNVENKKPRKFRYHYSNPMDSRSIMCSFGNGRLGNQVRTLNTFFKKFQNF